MANFIWSTSLRAYAYLRVIDISQGSDQELTADAFRGELMACGRVILAMPARYTGPAMDLLNMRSLGIARLKSLVPTVAVRASICRRCPNLWLSRRLSTLLSLWLPPRRRSARMVAIQGERDGAAGLRKLLGGSYMVASARSRERLNDVTL